MLGKLKRALERRGLAGALEVAIKYSLEPLAPYSPRRLFRRLNDWWYDLRYGVETSAPIDLEELPVEASVVSAGRRYQPTSERFFHKALGSIPISHDQFVFVDFGSGKGKCLLMASDYPFKRIIGVECSQTLTAVARGNSERYRSPRQKCRNLEFVTCDAALYEIPSEANVYYFYNPFDLGVLRKVRDNILHSLQVRPRPVYVLYYNPVHREVFDDLKLFTPLLESANYCIYVSNRDWNASADGY